MTTHSDQYDILILYASQTGNSEGEAEFLSLQLNQAGLKAKFSSLDNYQIENLPYEKYVVYMISTTGQGDPPDNMKNFWKFLLIKSLPADVLEEMNFTVFGFGDSKYEFYNSSARKLYQRLLQLGATTFCDRGLGDDQDNGGYLNSFLAWKTLIFARLAEIFPAKFDSGKIVADGLWEAPMPIYSLKISNENLGADVTSYPAHDNFIRNQMLPYLKTNGTMMLGKFDTRVGTLVKKTRETADDHWQNVMNLDFQYECSPGEKFYQPGDIACIYPENDPTEVSKLLKYFELEPATMLEISLTPENEFLRNSKS
jgi:sulfite reductase alpha subunit-like flavoprotein